MGQEQPVLELAYADVTEFAAAPAGDPTLAPPVAGNVQIDNLRLAFRESVWLQSPEMQVQIEGDLVVYRTGEDLRVFGALQALRGTYQLEISAIVREFDVISGNVQFFGTGELDPSLDIVAGYRVRTSTVGQRGDLTILVHLTGTLLTPRLQLTADTPVPLSEADLISYLMFGQPSFELGGVTQSFAQQLLVQEVVGGILATEFERSVRSAGLCDWFQVRPGDATNFQSLLAPGALNTAAIECGRELAPSLFLTAQANLGGLLGNDFTNGQIGMEWQIDQEWSWEATYGAVPRDPIFRIFDSRIQTQFSTDLRRQWEYGKPTETSAIDLTPADPEAGQLGPSPPPAPEILAPPELPPEPPPENPDQGAPEPAPP
jgi:hypothetical protein